MSTLETFIKSGVDPFAEQPLPKAYYHPSTEKKLSKNERRTCLSPERPVKLQRPSDKEKDYLDPSPGIERFLQQSNSVTHRELPTHDTPSPRDTSSKFDESWPTSERPSTIVSPESSERVQPMDLDSLMAATRHTTDTLGKFSQRQEPTEAADSTLARYIHRFRYGEPKSREERLKDDKQTEFWWLSPTNSTTTVNSRGRSPRRTQRKTTKSPNKATGKRHGGDKRNPSSSTSGDTSMSLAIPMYLAPDRLTDELQQRAQRLINQSESLSDPRVSTDGIGSSPSLSSFPDEDSMYLPRPLHSKALLQDKENIPGVNRVNQLNKARVETQGNVPRSQLAPQDDILYQWRLRRRLETARQDVQAKRPVTGLRSKSPPVRLSPHKPLVSAVVDDVESSLAAFRQRMAAQRETARNPPINIVETTSKLNTENKGSDPVPQNIATQTSPKNDDDTVSTGQNLDRQELPCRFQQTSNRHLSPSRLQKTPDRRRSSKSQQNTPLSQVASPHIQRDDSEDESDVTPHLHLMCDLLPCPHQVKVQGSHIQRSPKAKDIGKVQSPSKDKHSRDSPSKVSKQLQFDQENYDDVTERKYDTKKTKKTEKAEKEVSKTSTPKAVPGSPISTAIGQVIGTRLFSSPHKSQESSSPCSSPDLLPTMQSTVRPQSQDEGSVASSSEVGEDFEEDELLQLLYKKRSHYEEQLKHIDHILVKKLDTEGSHETTSDSN